MLAYLLLALVQVAGLLVIPLGAPGPVLQIAALGLFAWWTEFDQVGAVPLGILFFLAVVAELAQVPIAGGRISSSERRPIGFAGVAGGLAGAGLGLAFPLLGSMFGALLGAFAASLAATVASRRPGVGYRRLLAVAAALTLKAAAGVVIATFTLLALTR